MSEQQIRKFINTSWEGPDDEGEMRCVATLKLAGTATLSEGRYAEGEPATNVMEERAKDMLVSGIRRMLDD